MHSEAKNWSVGVFFKVTNDFARKKKLLSPQTLPESFYLKSSASWNIVSHSYIYNPKIRDIPSKIRARQTFCGLFENSSGTLTLSGSVATSISC